LRAPMTFAVLLVASLLGGCTASMALVDDAMSEVNGGGNCSFSRLLRGQTACEPPTETVAEANEKKVYCYQTLGGVDCYEKQDPFASSEGRQPSEKIKLGTPVVGPSKPVTKVPVIMMGKAKPMAQKPATTVPPTPIKPKKVVATPIVPVQTVKKVAPPAAKIMAPAPKVVAKVAAPVVTNVQPAPPVVEPATPSVGLSARRPVAEPTPAPQNNTPVAATPKAATPEVVPEDEVPATALPPKLKPSRKVWPKPATPAIES